LVGGDLHRYEMIDAVAAFLSFDLGVDEMEALGFILKVVLEVLSFNGVAMGNCDSMTFRVAIAQGIIRAGDIYGRGV
jgi:hypothetical protein